MVLDDCSSLCSSCAGDCEAVWELFSFEVVFLAAKREAYSGHFLDLCWGNPGESWASEKGRVLVSGIPSECTKEQAAGLFFGAGQAAGRFLQSWQPWLSVLFRQGGRGVGPCSSIALEFEFCRTRNTWIHSEDRPLSLSLSLTPYAACRDQPNQEGMNISGEGYTFSRDCMHDGKANTYLSPAPASMAKNIVTYSLLAKRHHGYHRFSPVTSFL